MFGNNGECDGNRMVKMAMGGDGDGPLSAIQWMTMMMMMMTKG